MVQRPEMNRADMICLPTLALERYWAVRVGAEKSVHHARMRYLPLLRKGPARVRKQGEFALQFENSDVSMHNPWNL